MQTSVLLSVKPQFARAILDGTKKFEFRRSIFRHEQVRRILLYASSPVQRVIGEFDLSEIITMELSALWRRTSEFSGITRTYFDDYFLGLEHGHALKVGRCRLYARPLELQRHFGILHAPQSFRYVHSD